jgi:hypothetical protein
MKTKLTKEQVRDSGLAAVLVCLMLSAILREQRLLIAGILLLAAAMALPGLFRPFAVLWFGFSKLTSAIVSRVLLTMVFFLVVTPVGLARRVFGRDPLGLKKFKKGAGTLFIERNHAFTKKDIENPY